VNTNVSKEDFGKLANCEGIILDKKEEFCERLRMDMPVSGYKNSR
jgi:hypothetical protein